MKVTHLKTELPAWILRLIWARIDAEKIEGML
jgi:hypothetical protein